MEPSCVLFIPVSSPSGIGEYMRSLIIANALKLRWPNIRIHFVLSDQVSYAKGCPYTVHSCKGSATKDVKTVNNIIGKLQPELVIFDASGRAKQFKQAKAVGAKVAFISQHNKKRNRGLKLNRLLHTDIHWVAQLDFCMKPLSFWQRTKLTWFNKQIPQAIGPVFEVSSAEYQDQLLAQYGLSREAYFIFNAGSGGHLIAQELAADIYYQAACAFSLKTGIKSLVVFGCNYPKELPKNNDVYCVNNINNKGFVALLAAAQGCVVSAGDTLLQCIALDKSIVAASVSPDQPARLKLCASKKLVLAAEPSCTSIIEEAQKLVQEQEKHSFVSNSEQEVSTNALEVVIGDIVQLFSNNKYGSGSK
ncbi:MAG: hypothetical protein GY928_17795 [Colwellia sp.]|nr:hypothetical protein [Colwellia sp.]